MQAILEILHARGAPVADSRLETMIAKLLQLSRYSVASAVAVALDFSVYLVLARGDMKPVLAGVLGYGAGLALHFLLSVRFVFNTSSSNKAQMRLLAEFALTGVAGLATTAIVMALATDVVGLPGLSAKVLAAGTSFVLVYWLRCTIVFGGTPSHPRVN